MQVLPKNFAMLFRTAFLLNTVRQLFLERHWIDETEVFLQFFGLGFHGFRDIMHITVVCRGAFRRLPNIYGGTFSKKD